MNRFRALPDNPFFVRTAALLVTLGALVGAFAAYVLLEKRVDAINLQRQQSLLLMDELRQSSHDLTQLARSYAATGLPHYRRHFDEIMAIREGRQVRPERYYRVYWDLVLADGRRPRPNTTDTTPLLQRMRDAGFTISELDFLADAKRSSDFLAKLENDAMDLAAAGERSTALSLLFGDRYDRARMDIMQPIDAAYVGMDERTRSALDLAQRDALVLRMVVIALGIFSMGMLVSLYRATRVTLGGSMGQIHDVMLDMAQGRFDAALARNQHSVLGWLGQMQHDLGEADAQKRRAAEELRVAAIAFEVREGMLVTDAEGRILRANHALAALSGYGLSRLVGESPDLLYERAAVASEDDTWEGEIQLRRADSSECPVLASITAVRGLRGEVTHYVHMIVDNSERKAREELVMRLAYFDSLTGLPNRRMLVDRLQRALYACSRSGQHGALCFLDLDRFKVLNDTHGHEYGDRLLQQVAGRLQEHVRAGDTVARLGGDEFVLVLETLDAEAPAALQQSEAVGAKVLAALELPYVLDGLVWRCSGSMGVALFGAQTVEADQLLRQADMAMYEAKKSGRNALRAYAP